MLQSRKSLRFIDFLVLHAVEGRESVEEGRDVIEEEGRLDCFGAVEGRRRIGDEPRSI